MPAFIGDYLEGKYNEIPDEYIKRSPIFNIKKVITPTLIQHGENDPRVPSLRLTIFTIL